MSNCRVRLNDERNFEHLKQVKPLNSIVSILYIWWFHLYDEKAVKLKMEFPVCQIFRHSLISCLIIWATQWQLFYTQWILDEVHFYSSIFCESFFNHLQIYISRCNTSMWSTPFVLTKFFDLILFFIWSCELFYGCS